MITFIFIIIIIILFISINILKKNKIIDKFIVLPMISDINKHTEDVYSYVRSIKVGDSKDNLNLKSIEEIHGKPHTNFNYLSEISVKVNELQLYLNKKNIELDNTLEKLNISDVYEQKEDIIVKYINPNDIYYITQKLIGYLNTNKKYEFSITDIPSKILTLKKGIGIKQYKLYLFLYEKELNIIRRIEVSITSKQYPNKNGILMLDYIKIEMEKDKIPSSEDKLHVNAYEKDILPVDINIDTTRLISEKDINIELKRRENVKKLQKKYSCVGIPDSNGITSEEKCNIYGGTWDREAQQDKDCPFYLSNKNYTNNRGGNKAGYCEMPSGLKIQGYTKYSKNPNNSVALCYNCSDNLIGQGTLGKCCESQINKYKSADYKFPGDQQERYNARYELEKNGLKYK